MVGDVRGRCPSAARVAPEVLPEHRQRLALGVRGVLEGRRDRSRKSVASSGIVQPLLHRRFQAGRV